MWATMDNAEEVPSYALNDPQALIRFLQEAYRRRLDVVVRADDCRYLADALREHLRNDNTYSGGTLF